MATIKSYTDINQSKKLAEFLPLESADMHSEAVDINGDMVFIVVGGLGDKTKSNYGSPVWSLAALLGVLPSRLFDATPKRKELYLLPDLDKSYCFYRQFAVKAKGKIYLLTEGEYLIDACVAMIEKLNERKML